MGQVDHLATADEAGIERAASVLAAGGTVVLPTDTVYGLATLPDGAGRLAELKGRPADMPVAVLVARVADAWALAADPRPAGAEVLADELWPGPLTLVLPGRSGGTVGVRCPDHALVQALAARVGPLATTSANRHGRPTPATAAEAAAELLEPPELVVDGGRCGGVPSTVVDLAGPEPVVRREGAVPASTVAALLGRGLPGSAARPGLPQQ